MSFALADNRHNGHDDLDARIARAKADVSGGVAKPVSAGKGYAQGSRVLAELIGAPLGGGLIGWLLDSVLGTKPWIMLVLLVLSVIVAFRNIYRISQERAE